METISAPENLPIDAYTVTNMQIYSSSNRETFCASWFTYRVFSENEITGIEWIVSNKFHWWNVGRERLQKYFHGIPLCCRFHRRYYRISDEAKLTEITPLYLNIMSSLLYDHKRETDGHNTK